MPEKMCILVVDDEQPARKKIISFLKETGIELDISEAANGLEACKKIIENKPELLFLDIQMPGMTGLEVIQNISSDELPLTIFVTAYDQYAVKAFEINAIDYLLKPFDRERFSTAFNRGLERLKHKSSGKNKIESFLSEIRKEKRYLERILVSSNSKYFFVQAEDIYYIEAEEKYIKIFTKSGNHLIRESMNGIEEKLNPDKFARIHRSYIVNVSQIQEMQPWSHGDFIVLLKNGDRLNMSRRYKENLLGSTNAD
jgi:two-component system, LytTR family, response regulator